jgi:signal transduction histidine kinase
MIGDVMLFARPPRPVCERIDLGVWLPGMLARFVEQGKKQGTQFDLQIAEEVVLWGDETQAGVAIGALLHNSLNALGEGGKIRLTAEPVLRANSTAMIARIAVEDDGPGLSPAEREHLFDPFYSGRQAGRGLGFGLPKAWRIVTMHGGTIQAIEREPRGVRMVIDWPLAEEMPKKIAGETGSDGEVV